MSRLKHALQRKYEEKQTEQSNLKTNTIVYTPRNCESVQLIFREEKMAKVIGSLAMHEPSHHSEIKGILVEKDFEYQIMSSKDLTEYTNLKTTIIKQRQWLQSSCPFSLVEYHLKQMFGSGNICQTTIDDLKYLTIMRDISVQEKNKTGKIFIEWIASPMMDLMVDAIIALILAAESSPVSVKCSFFIIVFYIILYLYDIYSE